MLLPEGRAFLDYCKAKGRNIREHIMETEGDFQAGVWDIRTDESYEQVIIAVDIAYFQFDGKYFVLDFHHQGGTSKITCQRPGDMKGRGPYMGSTPAEIGKIVPIFQKQLGEDKGYHCGPGNLPKMHAYVSMSKAESKADAVDADLQEEEFCKRLYAELETALPVIGRLKTEIEKIGGKFA